MKKLMKKIKGSGFDGGLKWNSQRAMYILDLDNREEGIHLLILSYSQYKDLEDRKLAIWKKLLEKILNVCALSLLWKMLSR